MLEELKMLSGLAGRQRNKLIASCALSVIGTALGLVPFVLIYLVMLELWGPVVDQAYIWKLVFWSIAAIVVRFGFMGLSGTLSHIAAYAILYDLRIKLAQKLGTLPLGLLVITRQPFGSVVIEIDDIEIAIGRGMAGKICVEVIA